MMQNSDEHQWPTEPFTFLSDDACNEKKYRGAIPLLNKNVKEPMDIVRAIIPDQKSTKEARERFCEVLAKDEENNNFFILADKPLQQGYTAWHRIKHAYLFEQQQQVNNNDQEEHATTKTTIAFHSINTNDVKPSILWDLAANDSSNKIPCWPTLHPAVATSNMNLLVKGGEQSNTDTIFLVLEISDPSDVRIMGVLVVDRFPRLKFGATMASLANACITKKGVDLKMHVLVAHMLANGDALHDSNLCDFLRHHENIGEDEPFPRHILRLVRELPSELANEEVRRMIIWTCCQKYRDRNAFWQTTMRKALVAEYALALCMSKHARVGKGSLLRLLPDDVLRFTIWERFGLGCHFEVANVIYSLAEYGDFF